MKFRAGFVSIIGRPNAGKSTLLNALVGEKIAIVSRKPQTTRNRIQGIVNVKAAKGTPAGQIVFVDTPGVHKPDSNLNRKMMHEVQEALEGRDLVLFLLDVTHNLDANDRFALQMLERAGGPAFLVLTKIDLIEKTKLLPLISEYSQLHAFKEVIPISSLKKDGLQQLLQKVVNALPEGQPYFPPDQMTDQPERFIAAELIREKILRETGEELPYATTVVVERFEEGAKLTRISATIYCEREGQKRILIGKGGSMLKKIGTAARLDIERLLGMKVFLELFVKVEPGWRESRGFVDQLDWRRQLEDMGSK
ncbi:MAG: GTPase Era [Terriglobales bacterium]